METGQILMNANKKEIARYSRQTQVKKLSEYLNYE